MVRQTLGTNDSDLDEDVHRFLSFLQTHDCYFLNHLHYVLQK